MQTCLLDKNKFLVVISIVFVLVNLAWGNTVLAAPGGDELTSAAQTAGYIPLPHDCDGFTPPGYPVPACCVSGYVYYASPSLLEPEIAAGALVTLTTASAVVTTTHTAPGLYNAGGQSYFYFDLEHLGIQPGDVVTFTSVYQDKQEQVVYVVEPGGQQVDVVLAEARDFDPATVIVDDADLAPSPTAPGFRITGPAHQISEAACSAGAEFFNNAMYTATTTLNGLGPATVTATYRPDLPVSGMYEVSVYAPHGCAYGAPLYVIHFPGGTYERALVEQPAAGEYAGRWISLGKFFFEAGAQSYIELTNVTGQSLAQYSLGIDAVKWELHSPFAPVETFIVDDLDAPQPDGSGFTRGPGDWLETPCCGAMQIPPIVWDNHLYWIRTLISAPTTAYGQWQVRLPWAGKYEVEVFIPHCSATARAARYRIQGTSQVYEALIDQRLQGGVWVSLGVYEFPTGVLSSVYVDNVTGRVNDMLAYDAIRFVAYPPFAPIATLQKIYPRVATQGESVLLKGSGFDTDGGGEGVVEFEWRSDQAGVIATTETTMLDTSQLAPGLHTLTFRVQDNEGLWSSPVTKTLEILPASLPETWHFMLYFAGDNNLSNHMADALYRLQQMTLPSNVTVTLLFDRKGAGGTYRYVLQGAERSSVNLGELNLGLTQTLASYVAWARDTYPAAHYYLSLVDHGRGIQGLAWDETSGGDNLTLPELREALYEATSAGSFKIDVLHLDACLMDMLEVAYEVAPYADYLIASENIGWATFGYERYVTAAATQPTPRALATAIAESYRQQVAYGPHTIAVLDLQNIAPVVAQVDALAQSLIAALPGEYDTLNIVLQEVQRFDSQDYGHITPEDEFIDLRHFAELLAAQSGVAPVRLAAQAMVTGTAHTDLIIYEAHASGNHGATWWNLEHANGVAIYFPASSAGWDYTGYVMPAQRLSYNTQWDELLQAVLGAGGGTPGQPSPTPPQPWDVLQRVYLPLVVRGK